MLQDLFRPVAEYWLFQGNKYIKSKELAAPTDAKTTTKTFVYDENTAALVRTDEIVDPFGFFLPAGT